MKENLPSNKKIGIIGGGQLGYMLIEAGTSMNLNFTTLDIKDAPCARLANKHISGSINEDDDIRILSDETDILTFEIEHIDINELLRLEAEGKKI
ncbi:MAG: 5-(carboxyamino)imidazole ribonucleotide synthase, partial [Bacteroidetes bacterium]|nr:5-(carboxyamino)imidazole ribonucleotide synthase [Bacteroidota bacterium]